MDIQVTECPFCHGNEFIEGKQEGYAQITSKHSAWYSGVLHHVICRRCGSVVRSYVKDPEKLLKKKDRKEK
jgi:Fe2+ or Zn2+ uptake regulation protein